MWEEFLSDSANRDKEARAAMQTSMSQNASPSSASAIGKMPSATPGMGPGLRWRHRRAPTLLDELEWADSDQRRSERERFDILLDRYEM